MKINTNPKDDRPFAQANLDKINHGVKDPNRNCRPPSLTAHVDNCLYTDTLEFMKQTIACSVISCEDVLGGKTTYQEDIISDEKFNAEYEETRVLLGHRLESRAMVVLLSLCCQEKLIAVIEEGRWVDLRQHTTIVEITKINGLLANAGEYLYWVRAQLFNLQELLREEISKGYSCEKAKERVRQQYKKISYSLPSDMSYHLKFL